MPLSFANAPSLIAYVTCGDPDRETTRDVILASIDAGADVVELGVPFSDPVADGPVIQRASERALAKGMTLAQVLEVAADIRRQSAAGLVVFSYLNPIMSMGLGRFCATARDAGIDGILVTDLPVEEAGQYIRETGKCGLSRIFLVAPTSTDERLRRIAEVSSGFVYAVSRTGVTGARQQLAGDARALVKRVRRHTKLPVAVGFGISTREQFSEVGEFADAAVIGSAIVETIERNPGGEAEAVAAFIRSIRGVARAQGGDRTAG